VQIAFITLEYAAKSNFLIKQSITNSLSIETQLNACFQKHYSLLRKPIVVLVKKFSRKHIVYYCTLIHTAESATLPKLALTNLLRVFKSLH